MHELGVALLSLCLMEGSFWGALFVQQRLRDHHRSRESIESIRVLITLLVTFAALVLGLLISSYQARFTQTETGLRALGIDMIELDRSLRDYGPELDPLRADLIRYDKTVIADLWPDETPPPGNYTRYRLDDRSIEITALGDLMAQVDRRIRSLAPPDAYRRSVAESLQQRMDRLLDQRWELIATAAPSLSWPFLVIILFWLVVIFAIAGLSSPRNLVVVAVTTMATLSLASSIFLALELDTPLTGFIRVSDAPLRDALDHLTQPPLPDGAP